MTSDKIPIEVLQKILTYNLNSKQLNVTSKVSRFWCIASNYVWKILLIRDFNGKQQPKKKIVFFCIFLFFFFFFFFFSFIFFFFFYYFFLNVIL